MLFRALLSRQRRPVRRAGAPGGEPTSRAWSRAGRSGCRTTCTGRCGTSTSTRSLERLARDGPRAAAPRGSSTRARGAPGQGRVREPRSTSCARRSKTRSAGGWWLTAAPRRWPGRCAARCPRTSTSCTPPATSSPRCAGPSTRSPASSRCVWPASAATAVGARSTFVPPCGARCPPAACRSTPISATPVRPSPRSSSSPTSPGSVAAFARFTVHLVYAISSQFSKVRSFVFIDGIDEVTRLVRRGRRRRRGCAPRQHRGRRGVGGRALGLRPRLVGLLGALGRGDHTPRRACLLLGDARNNYHASQSMGRPGDPAPGPPRVLAEPRAKAPTGARVIPSWASTPCTATRCSSAATFASWRSL